MPDQSQTYSKTTPPKQQPETLTGNPADTTGNDPADATPESVESNTTRVSEGEKAQAAQTIEGDPGIANADENDSPAPGQGGDNYDDEDAWSYRSLQHEAKERGLPGDGKRDELVSRLRQHDSSSDAQPVRSASGGGDPMENGGIARTEHATEHAEILQQLSDERRSQQLAGIREQSNRSGGGAD